MSDSYEDILADLVVSLQPGSGGFAPEPGTFTTTELADSLGCGRRRALAIIRALIGAGRVVPTTARIERLTIHGRITKVDGFRIVK